jgi:molybdopterin converting factor small subunit
MAIVHFTSVLRDVSGGRDKMEVSGATVAEVLEKLEHALPGVRERLTTAGRLDPSMTVVVDGLFASEGLESPVGEKSEIHFLPMIGGG